VGHDLGAARELVVLEHTDGPVPENRARRLDDLRVAFGGLGPDVQDHVVLGHVFRLLDGRPGSRRNLLGHDHVHGDGNLGAHGHEHFRLLQQGGLVQGLAHGLARGGEEIVGDAAAHDEVVDLARQRLQDGQFAGDLGPAHDGRQRTGRMDHDLAQRLELGHEQGPGAGDGRELRHGVGRGLGAMGRAERVHDVHVAQGGHFLAQGLVVGLLALDEAHVLAERDLAGRAVHAAEPVLDQPHRLAKQLLHVRGHWRQGKGFFAFAFLGSSQMGHDHDQRAHVQGLLDGGDAGADAGVVAHLAIFQRGVQVLSDERPFPGEVLVDHLAYGHGSLLWR